MKPDLEIFYKTAVQKRDPHFTKLSTINVWDMVTLKDTIRKKQEDEAKLERAHKQRLQMREYYRQQMEEKQKKNQQEVTREIYDKLALSQQIILDKNKAHVSNL
jgi:hypothetical protein